MRVLTIAVLISVVASGTVFAAPDEAPAAAKAVQQSVSVQLMDFGEGAARKIRLTLSDKWSNLPESTKKHVLEKLRAALPGESLKQALLALAQGQTEIEVSAAPKAESPVTLPMVKVVPAEKVQTRVLTRLGTPGERVVVRAVPETKAQGSFKLEGMPGKNVEVEVIEMDGLDEMPEDVRARMLEALKKSSSAYGSLRFMSAGPGAPVKVHKAPRAESGCSCGENKAARAEVKVVVTGDGEWQKLPPKVRAEVLQSLRQAVPQDQLAEVLKSLTMRGSGACDCGRSGPGRSGPHRGMHRGMQHGRQHGMRGGRQPGNQDALVRALVALTHEVKALRHEVAAMRATHGKPVAKPQPPRRMMFGAAPKAAAGRAIVIRKPDCPKCEGACKCAPKPPAPPRDPVRIVKGQDGQFRAAGMVMHKAAAEEDMAKLRAEMAEIRAALHKLMKDLEKLKTPK